MNSYFSLALGTLFFFSLTFLGAQNEVKLSTTDYGNADNWAALPTMKDSADLVPTSSDLVDQQATAPVDIFFLHPTTLTKKKDKRWNGDLDDDALNLSTDRGPIKYQASIFNGSGKVYAPRYRQAHLRAYYRFEKEKKKALQTFEVAYQDIRTAFKYYMDNYNEGRPIVIAAHSQGSTHAKRLLQEFFDGSELKKKLVVAYLVGMPIRREEFKHLKPCESAEQTGCYATWNTFSRNAKIKPYHQGAVATNPINWTIDGTYAPKSKSKGMVLRKFATVQPGMMDAQSKDGIIWVKKPRIPWGFLYFSKNYHIADYNLFYQDVRENVAFRIAQYLIH